MDHAKAALATRKFTRTMSDPEGTKLIELMCRVVIEAKKACAEASTYGAIGGEELVPLQEALDALDDRAVKSALESYLASMRWGVWIHDSSPGWLLDDNEEPWAGTEMEARLKVNERATMPDRCEARVLP
ncbi:MAG TPA: hypothetical protein VNV25_25290 [Gemmatimonadaceae bacterium]|jgi:hypothetical protein|nr:hypothetical protein [Gemmatimonadaceae bacterium]